MTIKIKILALSIITILLSAIGLTTLNVININSLSRENIETTRQRVIETKKLELQHYNNLADSAIYNLRDKQASAGEFIAAKHTDDWAKLNKEGQFPAFRIPEWISDSGFYTDEIDETVAEMENTQSQYIASIISSTLILSGLLVLILIVLSIFLANIIVKHLQHPTGRLQNIDHKDVDLTQCLGGIANNELGALAGVFHFIVAKVQTLLVKSVETVRSVAGSKNTGNSNCADTKVLASQGADSIKSSRVINELKDNVGDIELVVDAIRGIAEQTNLLAANAAIEATLAGEQGKSFVGITDELCILARRTQDSTQEIQNMIGRLQKDCDQAVVMLSRKNEVEQTVVHSARVSNSSADTTSAVSAAELNALLAEFKI